MTETKTCKRCGEAKPPTEFYRTDAIRGYLRTNCKQCDRGTARRYYQENPEYAERVRGVSRGGKPAPIANEPRSAPRSIEERRAAKAAYMRQYMANRPEKRASASVRSKIWAANHPDRYENRRDYILQWHKDNPVPRERKRRNERKSLYGLTEGEYAELLLWQGGACALCGSEHSGRKRPPEKWGRGVLAIDHCHKTDRVRGLLCHPCNARLGSYEWLLDTIGIERLKEYLQP